MSDFGKKLLQKYTDQQSSCKPKKIQNKNQFQTDGSDDQDSNNNNVKNKREESKKKKEIQQQQYSKKDKVKKVKLATNPKIKNKFFKEIKFQVPLQGQQQQMQKKPYFQEGFDYQQKNQGTTYSLDQQQQMDLIVKQKINKIDSKKKNKFNEKLEFAHNRRNFKMSHTDHQFKNQIKQTCQQVNTYQEKQDFDVVLEVPKICKGNNRYVDAAIYLKNIEKKKISSLEEIKKQEENITQNFKQNKEAKISSTQNQKLFEQSKLKSEKRQNTKKQQLKQENDKMKKINSKSEKEQKQKQNQSSFRVTSFKDVQKQTEQLILDEQSQKVFKKMKKVAQRIKQKKKIQQWKKKKNVNSKQQPKKKKKHTKKKKNQQIDNIKMYFEDQAQKSDGQGQFSTDQQQEYEGVQLDKQFADLIDNSQCFNQQDQYLARRKWIQDDKLKDQALIKKIKDGIYGKKRPQQKESESQKKRRMRMQDAAQKFKKEDEQFLKNCKGNSKQQIKSLQEIKDKDKQEQDSDSQQSKVIQIKQLKQELGINQKHEKLFQKKQKENCQQKTEKNTISVNQVNRNAFGAISIFIQQGNKLPKNISKEKKKSTGFLANRQDKKSISTFGQTLNNDKKKKKSKSNNKNKIFSQIEDIND